MFLFWLILGRCPISILEWHSPHDLCHDYSLWQILSNSQCNKLTVWKANLELNCTFVSIKLNSTFIHSGFVRAQCQNVIGRKLLFCLERLFSLPLHQFSKTLFSPLKSIKHIQTFIPVKVRKCIHELTGLLRPKAERQHSAN